MILENNNQQNNTNQNPFANMNENPNSGYTQNNSNENPYTFFQSHQSLTSIHPP